MTTTATELQVRTPADAQRDLAHAVLIETLRGLIIAKALRSTSHLPATNGGAR